MTAPAASDARRDRTSPRDAARLAALFLRVGAMNELQYRVNFVVHLVQSLLSLGTGLVVLALVFDRTEELGGWTRPQLLAVMGVFTLMGGIIRAVIEPNMTRMLEEIRLGTLDYVLTKPEDGQVLVSVREVRIWQTVDIVVGTIVIAVALVQLDGFGWSSVGAFVLLLAVGAVCVYCFWLLLASAGFWLVRMQEVQELFTGVYRAGQYPVGIYPGWLRASLTFLIPLAFAVTVPSEAITSRLDLSGALTAAAMSVALVAVSRTVFRRGLRRYSGASS